MMKIIVNENIFKLLLENMTAEEIDSEAVTADINATEGQLQAGNYKKGHIRVKGMNISIENPKGSYRKYDGGKTKIKNHYGYFSCTTGKDGDQVDVFIGPNIENFEFVYVVDQNNEDKTFDESKVMLGFNSKEEAKSAYLSNYSPDWKGFRSITQVSLQKFKKWLYRDRKQRKPFKDYVLNKQNG